MSPADQVREQGWCLLPALLNEQELVALRAAFADEGRGHTEHVDVTDATPHAELWRSLADREPLAGLVAALLTDQAPGARPAPVPTPVAVPTQVQVSVHGRNPRPGGGDQGLHADQPAARGGIRAVTALWMLDPFTAANGATRVVPASHRRRILVPRDQAQPGQRHPAEVIVTGEPGDVLVFDAHLWHSGRRNDSDHGRRSVQMAITRRTTPGPPGFRTPAGP